MGRFMEGRDAEGNVLFRIDEDGRIAGQSLEAEAAGVTTQGPLNGNNHVDLSQYDKGLIQKSPNGHRQRLQVTDAGISVWVDLD